MVKCLKCGVFNTSEVAYELPVQVKICKDCGTRQHSIICEYYCPECGGDYLNPTEEGLMECQDCKILSTEDDIMNNDFTEVGKAMLTLERFMRKKSISETIITDRLLTISRLLKSN